MPRGKTKRYRLNYDLIYGKKKMETEKCPVKDCNGIMRLEGINNQTYYKCDKCGALLRK